MEIVVQWVGETVLYVVKYNVLDIKGARRCGRGNPPPIPLMVGTFWKFWYKTLVFRVLNYIKIHLISSENELYDCSLRCKRKLYQVI